MDLIGGSCERPSFWKHGLFGQSESRRAFDAGFKGGPRPVTASEESLVFWGGKKGPFRGVEAEV